jgi:cob(I)alamin adenosyltransferase
MSKIYTRTGDQGETSLYTGKRVLKSCDIMKALGAIDECNSCIGVALAFFPTDPRYSSPKKMLERVQHSLFDVGAAVATPANEASPRKLSTTRFSKEAVLQLEEWMDEMEKELPPLKNFILPGGHPTGANLHLARTVCRQAERMLIPLHQQGAIENEPLAYLNRLSDFLFMSARYLNHLSDHPETIWIHE